MIGKQYAAVLPLPVRARARISRCSSNARGIARAWIKVGRAKPMSARALRSRASSMFENAEKVVACSRSRASGAIFWRSFTKLVCKKSYLHWLCNCFDFSCEGESWPVGPFDLDLSIRVAPHPSLEDCNLQFKLSIQRTPSPNRLIQSLWEHCVVSIIYTVSALSTLHPSTQRPYRKRYVLLTTKNWLIYQISFLLLLSYEIPDLTRSDFAITLHGSNCTIPSESQSCPVNSLWTSKYAWDPAIILTKILI